MRTSIGCPGRGRFNSIILPYDASDLVVPAHFEIQLKAGGSTNLWLGHSLKMLRTCSFGLKLDFCHSGDVQSHDFYQLL